jgi:6-phosphogluconate dehydrogenase
VEPGRTGQLLIEITAQIFRRIDDLTGKPLVDLVLDTAQQKGTGKWTSQDSFNIGAPIPTINSAVVARIISSMKPERVAARPQCCPGRGCASAATASELIDSVRQALYASKISAYAQGMAMLRIASQEYGYDLNLGEVAAIWRRLHHPRPLPQPHHRCVPARRRAAQPAPRPDFAQAVSERLPAWRYVVQTAVQLGIPAPAFSASLAYYDSYRSARLPANLIQAQRDYFGAHTYERVDMPGAFHSDWA